MFFLSRVVCSNLSRLARDDSDKDEGNGVPPRAICVAVQVFLCFKRSYEGASEDCSMKTCGFGIKRL